MSDPLRVALLTARMSPAAGGLSESVPGLAHGLDIFDDIETHVLGTQDASNPDAANSWGPRVQAFPVTGFNALQRAPTMAPALVRLAPDLIDVQGLWTWASKVSLDYHRLSGTPYIVTVRGMLDPWARANSAWKKRLFATFAENKHLRGATALRATAEMEAQHFRDYGLRSPIAVVPNAISVPPLMPRKGLNGRRKAVFLSRIHPKKGISFLLRAWAKLEQEFDDWDLEIAGIDEGGHEAEMKALARSLDLKRISFVGPLYGPAKDTFYRQADLFILPTHAENFGLVVAEALSHEVPVITTTNAPWEGLKRNGCGWSITLDETKLTTTMGSAMKHPRAELFAMGSKGRSWIERSFSSREVMNKMRCVYRWAAGRAPRPDFVYD